MVYRIEVGEASDCIASWRRTVRLPPGRYRFAAELRGEEIKPRPVDDRGVGAGLRISGAKREQGLQDTFDWQNATYEFDLLPQSSQQANDGASETEEPEPELYQVELISELRATAGWCEMRAPTLTRLPNE